MVNSNYKTEFIDFIIKTKAITFGDFTLKSGRKSPYFFNAGLFNSGEYLSKLGDFYAQAIIDNNINFNILFGPAYKGIPLANTTCISLYKNFGLNINYSFNRKEAKDHGDGGSIVGAKLNNDILIIDDVITAGTAISEVMHIMHGKPVTIKGVIIALDRKEYGKNNTSAIAEITKLYNIPVFSIITIYDIITYLGKSNNTKALTSIKNYLKLYGV